MRRVFLVYLLVFGLILSWTAVYASDFYVIPTKKQKYAPVEKTGQTSTIPLNPAPTGSDGDLQKGVAWPDPRFTDNLDGTVTDNLTGLIWLKNANCNGKMQWFDNVGIYPALAWANRLSDGCVDCGGAGNDCGLSDGSVAGDWRLPNRKELASLLDLGLDNPALPDTAGTAKWMEGNAFTGVRSDLYWSSTTQVFTSNYAWWVDFYHGYAGAGIKTDTNYVWPVRGGE